MKELAFRFQDVGLTVIWVPGGGTAHTQGVPWD